MNVHHANQPQQDEKGNWWARHPQDGTWLWWDGSAWITWTPPVGATPSLQKTNPQGSSETREAAGAHPQSAAAQLGTQVQDQVQPQPHTAPAQTKEQISTSAEPQTLVDLLILIGKSLLKSLPKKIILVCAVLVGTWFVHTFLLAYVNDGFFHVRHPLLAMILSLERGQFGGMLFWTLLAGIISTLVTTYYQEGITPLISRIKQVPAAIRGYMQSTGSFAPAILLGAGGLALLLGITIAHRGVYVPNRMVSLLLVIALLLTLSKGFQGFVFLVTRLAWQDLRRNMAGQIKSDYNPRVVSIVLAGMTLGFALATLLPFLPWTGYLVVISLFVLAVLASFKKATPGTLMLISFGSAIAALLCSASEVFACYGGFHEYGGSLEAWLTRPGGNAATSMWLGVPPAIGATIGSLLPGIISGMNLPGGATKPPGYPPGPGGPGGPALSSRTFEEIIANPQWHDRVVGGDGNEYIYHIPAGDISRTPFWVSYEDYLVEQDYLRRGHVFVNGHWVTTEQARARQEWTDRNREQFETRVRELNQRQQDYLLRQAISQAQAESQAEWLENIAERIRSGRHPLSESDQKEDFLRGLDEASQQMRESGEFNRLSEIMQQQVIDQMRPELEEYLDGSISEMERALRNARIMDIGVKGAELVQDIADKCIDGLATVTPGGQIVRNSYLAARALGGGLAEGHITGEYGRSLFEHGSASVGDYIEGGPLGGKKNKMRRRTFQVFRSGAESAYESGLEAYEDGESMGDVITSAGRSFAEGSTARASRLLGDHLGDKYGKPYKYVYRITESGIQSGYKTYWESNAQLQDLSQRLEAGEITEAQFEEAVEKIPSIRDSFGEGMVEGAWNVGIESTLSEIGDHILPDTRVKAETMREQLDIAWNIETSQENLGELLSDDWSRVFIRDTAYGEIKDVVEGKVKDRVDQVIGTNFFRGIRGL